MDDCSFRGCEFRLRLSRIIKPHSPSPIEPAGGFPMPRLQTFFECAVRAICDTPGIIPVKLAPLGDPLLAIIRSTHQQLSRMPEADVRAALREAVAAPQETFDLELEDAIAAVAASRPWIKRAALMEYLELIQATIRQSLRRPGDTAGTSVPEHLPIGKPEDWLTLFPDRMARYKPGDTLKECDEWQLTDLRGFGPFGETWHGLAPENTDRPTSLIKFITDPQAATDFAQHEELFRLILSVPPTSGLVPLRSVYLLADPPCFESAFVTGYDVGGLIRDWRWRNEAPKPEQTAAIVKRVAKIVGGLHQYDPPIVHRGLKPANILLHPTAEGKVTIWVSDLGWSEISSRLALACTEQVQARRQARRGSLASLYASPEQQSGRRPILVTMSTRSASSGTSCSNATKRRLPRSGSNGRSNFANTAYPMGMPGC